MYTLTRIWIPWSSASSVLAARYLLRVSFIRTSDHLPSASFPQTPDPSFRSLKSGRQPHDGKRVLRTIHPRARESHHPLSSARLRFRVAFRLRCVGSCVCQEGKTAPACYGSATHARVATEVPALHLSRKNDPQEEACFSTALPLSPLVPSRPTVHLPVSAISPRLPSLLSPLSSLLSLSRSVSFCLASFLFHVISLNEM